MDSGLTTDCAAAAGLDPFGGVLGMPISVHACHYQTVYRATDLENTLVLKLVATVKHLPQRLP